MTKKTLIGKLKSRLKPDELSLNLGRVTATYDLQRRANSAKISQSPHAQDHEMALAFQTAKQFLKVLLDSYSEDTAIRKAVLVKKLQEIGLLSQVSNSTS